MGADLRLTARVGTGIRCWMARRSRSRRVTCGPPCTGRTTRACPRLAGPPRQTLASSASVDHKTRTSRADLSTNLPWDAYPQISRHHCRYRESVTTTVFSALGHRHNHVDMGCHGLQPASHGLQPASGCRFAHGWVTMVVSSSSAHPHCTPCQLHNYHC